MKLTFVASEPGPRKWYARTDDGNYDGAGITPIDAVCDLVAQMEHEGVTSR